MDPSSKEDMNQDGNPRDKSGLCLLSLDGGGVRGLSSLYTLKLIMDRLNDQRGNLPRKKPCEVFDLIGGTSTGGLIAIMLGRLEMDVDECIAAYTEFASDVFSEKASRVPISFKGDIKARFDSKRLSNAIQKVLACKGLTENDLLNDGAARGCKTFVCTVDRNTKNIERLRSYRLADEPNIQATILQATLATSAATTFFHPIQIGNRTFADGALGANNPVDEVESEASNIWCPETGNLQPLVKCFISIGTGHPGITAFDDNILGFLRKTLVAISIETEKTERKFIARWTGPYSENRYFRFNVEQGLQHIGLAEFQKMGEIESATQAHLTHTERKKRLGDCVQNLKLKQNRPDKEFSMVIEEYLSRPKPEQNIFYMPFHRNPNFTGRETLIKELQDRSYIKQGTSRQAVCGLGGTGKTALVIEYAHRVNETHAKRTVIWIQANTTEKIREGYLHVIQRLQIPGWKNDKASVTELMEMMNGHLSRVTDHWLLIFDNADDIEMWNKPLSNEVTYRLIDFLPQTNQGCIIFTTRDKKVAVTLAEQSVIEVGAMGDAEAAKLLQNSLIVKSLVDDQLATQDLLAALTHLPLAIVQATAYINMNDISLSEYSSLMAGTEEEIIELLSEDFEDRSRYPDGKNPVAITWFISFNRIRRQNPLAAQLLSFIACVYFKAIPQPLLPFPPKTSRKKEIDAVGTLTAYAFVTRHSGLHVSMLDVHRLVHLSTRNWLRKEKITDFWINKAICRLDEVLPDPNNKSQLHVFRTYSPHADYVLNSRYDMKIMEGRIELQPRQSYSPDAKLCIGVDPNLQSSQSLQLRRNLGLWLTEDAEYAEAEKNLRVASALQTALNEDHPDMILCFDGLRKLFVAQEQWRPAQGWAKYAQDLGEKIFGQQDERTWQFKIDFLECCAERQMDYGQEVSELRLQASRQFGHESHITAKLLILESLYFAKIKGDFDTGTELIQQAVHICKESFGDEDDTTLKALTTFAEIIKNGGFPKIAQSVESKILSICEKRFGLEHPKTLGSIQQQLATAALLEDNKEAMRFAERCTAISCSLYGEEHRSTQDILVRKAAALLKADRLLEAEKILEGVVKRLEKMRLVEKSANLTWIQLAFTNLMLIYEQLHQLSKAKDLWQQQMKFLSRTPQPEFAVITGNAMQRIYEDQGRFSESEQVMQDIFKNVCVSNGTEQAEISESWLRWMAKTEGGSEYVSQWLLAELQTSDESDLTVLKSKGGNSSKGKIQATAEIDAILQGLTTLNVDSEIAAYDRQRSEMGHNQLRRPQEKPRSTSRSPSVNPQASVSKSSVTKPDTAEQKIAEPKLPESTVPEQKPESKNQTKWAITPLPRGYEDITSLVDMQNIDIRNVDQSKHPPHLLFSNKRPKYAIGSDEDKIDWIESSTDAQIMLYIPFMDSVKVHSLHILSLALRTEDDDEDIPGRPQAVDLYINRQHILDFHEAENMPATQSIELMPQNWNTGSHVAIVQTRLVKFQSVRSLVVFISSAEDEAEKTRIDRLMIVGQASGQ